MSYDFPLGAEGKDLPRSLARQIAMLDRYELGETYERIGDDYCMTREAIRRNCQVARSIREFWYKRFAEALVH